MSRTVDPLPWARPAPAFAGTCTATERPGSRADVRPGGRSGPRPPGGRDESVAASEQTPEFGEGHAHLVGDGLGGEAEDLRGLPVRGAVDTHEDEDLAPPGRQRRDRPLDRRTLLDPLHQL